jgi:hypothetical protein
MLQAGNNFLLAAASQLRVSDQVGSEAFAAHLIISQPARCETIAYELRLHHGEDPYRSRF